MQLSDVSQGDHVCAIYQKPDEQLQAVARYIHAGLLEGERCLYIVDDRSASDVLEALIAEGVDVAAAQANGRLVVLTKRETYLKDGAFNPDQMIWALSAMTDQAISDHCAGLRITGEMTWALGSDTECDRLMDYETKLNQFFPGSRAHAICQYNRTRFGASVIREVLRHHPLAVIGDSVYVNPYFEPSELLGLPDGHHRRVEHMIKQIARSPRRRPRRFSAGR